MNMVLLLISCQFKILLQNESGTDFFNFLRHLELAENTLCWGLFPAMKRIDYLLVIIVSTRYTKKFVNKVLCVRQTQAELRSIFLYFNSSVNVVYIILYH